MRIHDDRDVAALPEREFRLICSLGLLSVDDRGLGSSELDPRECRLLSGLIFILNNFTNSLVLVGFLYYIQDC